MQLSSKTRLLLGAILVCLAFVAGRFLQPGGGESPMAAGHAHEQGAPEVWTCSMHPQVRLPEPGKCPICGMDLIRGESDSGDLDEGGAPLLSMSESAVALAEIETAPVQRRSVAHEVRMVGKIAFDETRMAYITSWVSGRLDRLFVDYTGVSVRADDHLVEIYSPTLYSAQQELLQAISTSKKLTPSRLDVVRDTSEWTVDAAREKLRLYGLSESQIKKIEEKGTPEKHVTILAPIGGIVVHKNALEGMYVNEGTRIYTIADLSKLWVLLDAYESDLAWLRYGQDVEFGVAAYPGERFHGRVAFIDPLLNDRTRTVKVRLNVDNKDRRLKPEMFVSALVQAVLTEHGKVVDENLADKWMCPMHPEVIADQEEACPECGMQLAPASELGFAPATKAQASLVIPSTAPLITGKRAVVYVRVGDQEHPSFEGRVISLGPRAGDWYVVKDGLVEGEQVVVKGNFKIDSELQIRARPSMMNPAQGGAHTDHEQHGGMSSPEDSKGPTKHAAPVGFRVQLGVLLGAYTDLQQSLAEDIDDATLPKALVDALGEVDMAQLSGPAHMDWMARLSGLEQALEELAQAEDINARRKSFGPLSEQLILALKVFGFERWIGDINVFLCPMAIDGEPAQWLQLGEETNNPYMGSSMLRCGSFVESLKQEN